MPRVYKPDPRGKTYKKPEESALREALSSIDEGMSYRIASERYGIHYSVLYRHHKKRNLKPQGGQIALSRQEEEVLMHQLIVCSDWGYPLDHFDVRMVVKTYLDCRGKIVPKFKDNLPGRDFVYCFLKRHREQLRTRICQNIKRSRAGVSPASINAYFDNLAKELKDVPPSNIINFDETNLTDDPGRKKIISKRGCRYPERICNTSKSAVSIMFASSADGKLFPPYVVYKAKHLYISWTVGGPKGARYNRSASGWFDAASFSDWVEKIIIPALKNLPGRKYLIGDNLSSHFSASVVSACEEHNISFIFLPANSTHLTQPLDVAFFRPLKTAWRSILEKFKMGAGSKYCTVPKDRFPHLLNDLLKAIEQNSAKNIQSGFEKCGIFPLNRDRVLDRLPQQNEVNDGNSENVVEGFNNSFVHLLKTMRYGDGQTERRRRRKIQVDAGKSVKGADFESSSDEESSDKENQTQNIDSGSNMETSDTDSDREMNLPLSSFIKIANKPQEVPSAPEEETPPFVCFEDKLFQHVSHISLDLIQEGIWLLVCFPTKYRNMDKNKFYIGQVTKIGETDIEANFLRSRCTKQFSGYIYEFPNVPDITTFSFHQVVGQVFPFENEVSSSKRDFLRFHLHQNDLN